MWFWIVGGASIWVLGMIIYYILDGWFDYGFKDEDTGFFIFTALIWPIWIWFVIPGIFAGKAHDALKEKRKKHLKKLEAQNKIRVAAEKELQKIEEELDSVFEQEEEEEAVKKPVRKMRANNSKK